MSLYTGPPDHIHTSVTSRCILPSGKDQGVLSTYRDLDLNLCERNNDSLLMLPGHRGWVKGQSHPSESGRPLQIPQALAKR